MKQSLKVLTIRDYQAADSINLSSVEPQLLAMVKVDEFLVERWMNEYEHDVEVNMAETCVKPFTLREFLDFTGRPAYMEEIMDRRLTYGWIEGSPELREGIAG
ncbi:MAG: hypothetical protein GTO63_30380, partial [Anaerolineae bacterium]|nr:hypothetical protein [Anaerolineae bacterium]NIN99011.1 hypothetical protein [Anaerolineae bacterium]NIQ81861.1 hypothetical protein [Anaerolineae bacterium]